jgi:hypothetical protein
MVMIARIALLAAVACATTVHLAACAARNPGVCSSTHEELQRATTLEIVETWARCEDASYNADCKERMRLELVRRGVFTKGQPVVGDMQEVVILCWGRLPDSKRIIRERSPRVERWTRSLGGLFGKDDFVVLTDGRVTEVGYGTPGHYIPPTFGVLR